MSTEAVTSTGWLAQESSTQAKSPEATFLIILWFQGIERQDTPVPDEI